MMHKLQIQRRRSRRRFSSAVTDLPKHTLCSRGNLSRTIQGRTPGNLCDDVRDLVKAATHIALEIKLYSLEVGCTSFLSNNHRLASGWKQHEATWQLPRASDTMEMHPLCLYGDLFLFGKLVMGAVVLWVKAYLPESMSVAVRSRG